MAGVTPSDVGAANNEGTSGSLAKADHVHRGATVEDLEAVAADLTAHEAASDPHPGYLTAAEGDAAYQPLDSDLTTWAACTPGTGVTTALAVNVGTDGAFVVKGGALGTPASGTLSSCTAASQSAAGVMSAADKLKFDTRYPVAKLDNTNSWNAWWEFEGTVNDSSGNGYNLALESGSGTIRYTKSRSAYNNAGELTAVCIGIGNCQISANIAALRHAGDVTLAMLFRPRPSNTTPTGSGLFGCTQATDSSTHNTQYSISLTLGGYQNGFNPVLLRWFSESGAGVDAEYEMTEPCSGPCEWILVHAVRESNVVKFYINGALVNTSGTLTAPDGGATSKVCIGGAGSSSVMSAPFDCACAAIKLSALNATQVLNDAKRVWGVN